MTASLSHTARALRGRSSRLGAALAALAWLAACPRVPGADLSNITDKSATARVHQSAGHRGALSGVVKAKLPGLQGAVMSANLDVALEPPALLSVAVESFFQQPQQILVTDGANVTFYDATSGQPVWKRGPVDEKTVQKLLPIPVGPGEVVAMFLARPGEASTKGRLVSVDEKAGTFDVWFEPAGLGPCQVTVRAADDAIVHWRQMRKNGLPAVDVDYGDFRAGPSGALLPFKWTLTLVDTKESLDFVGTDVTWNGEIPDGAFHLEPPENTPVLPL